MHSTQPLLDMLSEVLPGGWQRGLFGGPLDESRVRKYWEAMSPSYAPGARSGLVRFSHRRQHNAVLQLAHPKARGFALDAGAGGGLLTRRLLEAGCEVTAVDANESMVRELRKLTPSAVLSRLEDLDLGRTFDNVYAIGVLNFVCTPEDTLRRLCSHLRPGGTLTLQVTELSLFGLLYWLTYWTRGFRPYLFSRDWLVRHAGAHGLELLGWTRPYPHDLTVAFRRCFD